MSRSTTMASPPLKHEPDDALAVTTWATRTLVEATVGVHLSS
jgi:hypothetical protein